MQTIAFLGTDDTDFNLFKIQGSNSIFQTQMTQMTRINICHTGYDFFRHGLHGFFAITQQLVFISLIFRGIHFPSIEGGFRWVSLNFNFYYPYGKERNLENSDSDHHHGTHGHWHEPGDVELYVDFDCYIKKRKPLV